ncbi:MAG: DUF4270 domain-containing protein [Flavobacteriaceae bacterium]|nr:DUF4270 domain-containing protein [Flavobacteriaceae bacterium]
MKKIKVTLQNCALIIVLILLFVGCENNFTSIGTGIIGNNNFETSSMSYPVISYNFDLDAVQSNNLPSNNLGFHSDPLYGDYSASIVAQMSTESFDPAFGENVVLDSVVLYIPYFSRVTDTDEDGNSTYELDSIFGNTPIKLSVFENRYFLRDFDPALELGESLTYFSDRTASDGSVISDGDLEGELLYTNDAFEVSSEQINLEDVDEEGETFISQRFSPGIRVLLDNPNDFWQNLIFNMEGEPELSNQSNFLNHFRGIYLKAEATDVNGTMMLLNLGASASITLYYSNDFDDGDEDEDGIPNYADVDVDGDGMDDNGVDTDGDGINDDFDFDQTGGVDDNGDGIDDDLVQIGEGVFTLNFGGNSVNFYDNNLIDIPDGDEVNGDEKLFLKGAVGSMAVINLFNGDDEGNSPELEEFKANNWLINEANLVFYVDQNTVQGPEPNRIFIYNAESNTLLIDYLIDQSLDTETLETKIDHLHPLERVDDEPDGQGIKYKIEITEHINNIFLRDSTNVKLGLAVTTDIGAFQSLDIKDADDLPEKLIAGSVLSTKGTVLFGNNTTDEEKKLKLEIFYTEPDN